MVLTDVRVPIPDLSNGRGWALMQLHLSEHATPNGALPQPRIVFADEGIRVIACGAPNCSERWIESLRKKTPQPPKNACFSDSRDLS